MRSQATLTRDCEAAEIPYGGQVNLPAGSVVTITQSLGGSYTVITDHGYMVRIADKDVDALGEEFAASAAAAREAAAADAGGKTLEQLAWDRLKTCYDPEIHVNIVDLGLVHSCEVAPRPEGGHKAAVRFTLTAPGCGMGDVLRMDIEGKLLTIPGVRHSVIGVFIRGDACGGVDKGARGS